MRKFISLILATLVIAWLFFLSSWQIHTAAFAQTYQVATPNADCKPVDLIKKAAVLKPTGDDDKDLDALLALAKSIDTMNIACRGLSFKGTNAKLIGPFDLPAGDYKVTLKTAGFFAATIKVLSGSCGDDLLGGILFNDFAGQAKDGAELLLSSQGCRMAINSSNVTAPWTLTLESVQ